MRVPRPHFNQQTRTHPVEQLTAIFAEGLWNPPLWAVAVWTLALTHVTIASVTIFLHRCQAHRSLSLHPAASHFFRFWLWLTTGMVTKEWAAVHRKHHAKAETEDDPHSPQVHGLAKILWTGVVYYVRETRKPETMIKYGHGTPDDWLENRLYSAMPWLGITLMAAINIALFGALIGGIVWVVQMAWIPFWAAGVINGVGHYWGYRNFQPKDESRNIVPLGILIGGEELHNNHHAFPTSARLSNRWYEFDVGWLYIRALSALGLAKVKRVAPTLLAPDARSACDLDTLQAILSNRFEVATRFARALRSTCQRELRDFRVRAGASAPRRRALSDWLHGMESRLSGEDLQALKDFFHENRVAAEVAKMRKELALLWDDRAATAEQLVERLRDWCKRAEESSVEALREFARDLRGYQIQFRPAAAA